jgi:hypothetical protein
MYFRGAPFSASGIIGKATRALSVFNKHTSDVTNCSVRAAESQTEFDILSDAQLLVKHSDLKYSPSPGYHCGWKLSALALQHLFKGEYRTDVFFQHPPYHRLPTRPEKQHVRDGCMNMRMAVKKLYLCGKIFGHPDIVAIQKSKQFAAGKTYARVPCTGET